MFINLNKLTATLLESTVLPFGEISLPFEYSLHETETVGRFEIRAYDTTFETLDSWAVLSNATPEEVCQYLWENRLGSWE